MQNSITSKHIFIIAFSLIMLLSCAACSVLPHKSQTMPASQNDFNYNVSENAKPCTGKNRLILEPESTLNIENISQLNSSVYNNSIFWGESISLKIT